MIVHAAVLNNIYNRNLVRRGLDRLVEHSYFITCCFSVHNFEDYLELLHSLAIVN